MHERKGFVFKAKLERAKFKTYAKIKYGIHTDLPGDEGLLCQVN
jgi:hypothetical protein